MNIETKLIDDNEVSSITSELLYREFEGHGVVVVGFECTHCKVDNMLTGEDADYMSATGKHETNGITVFCKKCKKESSTSNLLKLNAKPFSGINN